MSKLTEYIGSQFGNPRGIVGFICCKCMNIINKKMYKKTVSLLDLGENQKLLDIGYGNGYLLKLADKKFGCNLFGIDISEDMKNLAEKRNKIALQENRLNLEVGDCCNLCFEDNTFNAVSSINTVYFWQDTVKGLSEIRRCLIPGGCFINAVYTKEWLSRTGMAEKGFKKFDSEELVELGKQAGFEKIEVSEIVKGKSFAVIYKKNYNFYGWQTADVKPVNEKYKSIKNPRELYDLLLKIWCAETCAPRMRENWKNSHPTYGQCSITAFLAQDIFGGEVYGILREGGNYHCYNVIGNCVFDLTSEQFGDEKLSYENNPVQKREVHFAKEEKKLRYEYLKSRLEERLD